MPGEIDCSWYRLHRLSPDKGNGIVFIQVFYNK